MPVFGTYLVKPSRAALTAASTTRSGVGKLGLSHFKVQHISQLPGQSIQRESPTAEEVKRLWIPVRLTTPTLPFPLSRLRRKTRNRLPHPVPRRGCVAPG